MNNEENNDTWKHNPESLQKPQRWINFKNNHKLNNYEPVHKTRVNKLDLDYVRPDRGGVIIYTKYGNTVYFGLGVDAESHEFTDFAGGISYKQDNNVIDGSLREFSEEALRIFGDITSDMISECPVLYDQRNCIIFIHVKVDPNMTSEAFNIAYREQIEKGKKPEVCGITWLTYHEFITTIIKGGNIYSRTRNFLKRAGDFMYLL